MADIFVSYKAEDGRRVASLVKALEADGLSVWWDAQIGGGDEWRDVIQQHLDEAKCVIVVWSKRSIGPEGHFVRDEATRAQRRHIYLPVCIDKVDPPLGFGEVQAISLVGWHGEQKNPRYQSVLAAARAITSGISRPHHTQVERPGVSRRTVITGSAATVALAGVGTWALLKLGGSAATGRIAVLPFANLSGDPAQAYFSDGIAEELRSALGRIAGLEVVGRTSSEAVRNESAEAAAKKLSVAHILTGSVRQSPSMIRVSAQLIDADNGLERWSENYDRTRGDAIKIQIDIATKVARALSVALGQAGETALTAGGTTNAKAQDLLLRARELYNQADSKADIESALQLADRAIMLDPNYAEAYALKVLFLDYARSRYSTSAAELSATQREMLRLASRAAELSPDSAIAHVALARHFESMLDMGRAGREYTQALRLAQGDAAVLPSYSVYATNAVSPAEGITYADKAVALDPLNPDSHRARINALLDARRFAEAVRIGKELERNSPELFNAPIFVGDSLFWLGRFDEAANYYRRRPPDHFARITGEAMIQIRSGDRAGAQRNLARLQQIFGDAASYQYGEIYAQLGDKDRAFAALERAWTVKDPGLIRLRVDPALDPLRSDSRYKIIEEKLNFP